MPIKQAAMKALRQAKKKTVVNKRILDGIEYLSRKIKKALEGKKADEAQKFFTNLVQALDKAAKNGVIKKNNASRKKSRISRKINALLKAK